MGNAQSSPPTGLVGILFCSANPGGVGHSYAYADDMGLEDLIQTTCVFQGTTSPPSRNRALTSPAVQDYHVFYRDTKGPYSYWGAARRTSWAWSLHAATGRQLPAATLVRAPERDVMPLGFAVSTPFPRCVSDFYAFSNLRNIGIWHTAVFAALLPFVLDCAPDRFDLPSIHADGPHTRGVYVYDLGQRAMLGGGDYKSLPDSLQAPPLPGSHVVPDDSDDEAEAAAEAAGTVQAGVSPSHSHSHSPFSDHKAGC